MPEPPPGARPTRRERVPAPLYPPEFLPELEALARDLGVRVQYDDADIRGGLCRIAGETTVLLPRRARADEKIEQLAACLSGLDVDRLYVRPALRALIERFGPGEAR